MHTMIQTLKISSLSLLTLLSAASPVSAGGFDSFMLTFSAPDSEYGKTVGIDIFAVRENNFGFYARFQNNDNTPRNNYFDNIEITDNNDQITAQYRDSTMYTMGATRYFTDYFSAYMGAGYAEHKGYADKKGMFLL